MKHQRIQLIAVTLLTTLGIGVASTSSDGLPEYTITRSAGPITIDGVLDESSWTAAVTVGDFQFPWWKAGDMEQSDA